MILESGTGILKWNSPAWWQKGMMWKERLPAASRDDR
jgi:hypothetical protein